MTPKTITASISIIFQTSASLITSLTYNFLAQFSHSHLGPRSVENGEAHYRITNIIAYQSF